MHHHTLHSSEPNQQRLGQVTAKKCRGTLFQRVGQLCGCSGDALPQALNHRSHLGMTEDPMIGVSSIRRFKDILDDILIRSLLDTILSRLKGAFCLPYFLEAIAGVSDSAHAGRRASTALPSPGILLSWLGRS